MTTVLHLLASPRGAASHSGRFSTKLVDRLCRTNPHGRVLARNLAANPPPLANAAILGAAASDDSAFAPSEALIRRCEGAMCS